MEIQEKIINWVMTGRGDLNHKVEVTESTDLLRSGLLDSLDLLQLVTYVEDEFDLKIPVQALTPDNFSTPASVSILVSRIATDSC